MSRASLAASFFFAGRTIVIGFLFMLLFLFAFFFIMTRAAFVAIRVAGFVEARASGAARLRSVFLRVSVVRIVASRGRAPAGTNAAGTRPRPRARISVLHRRMHVPIRTVRSPVFSRRGSVEIRVPKFVPRIAEDVQKIAAFPFPTAFLSELAANGMPPLRYCGEFAR